MKKLLSIALVALMLSSIIAAAVPVSANADFIDYVEALYFTSSPKLDGIITDAEWGAATFSVNSLEAATKDDKKPFKNRFFYFLNGYDTKALAYSVWLRWDENYFYVGAKVDDPDGHSLVQGKTNTWDGDSVQFRLDPEGPNSICGGSTFYTSMNKTDGKPWGAPAQTCDIVFGYCQIAGGFSEAYENVSEKGITSYSKNPLGDCQIAIAPTGYKYSTDTANGFSTYEIAVPWSYIDPSSGHKYAEWGPFGDAANGNINREFGMSLVVLNSTPGESHFNSYLTWGSGICSAQQEEAPATCGGSNSVTMSGKTVTPTVTGGTVGGVKGNISSANYASPSQITMWQDLTFEKPEDQNIWGADRGGEVFGAERIQLDDGDWVLRWDKTTDPDADPNELHDVNYINTCDELNKDILYGTPRADGTKYINYTFEFDICVTDTQLFEPGYPPVALVWFGGASSCDYVCGYFYNDKQFKIAERNNYNNSTLSNVLVSKSMDFPLNTWHKIRFQFDNDTCTARFYVDGELIFNVSNRYFYYANQPDGCMMIFNRMNIQCMMDDVKVYNFVDYLGTNQSGQEIIEGGGKIEYEEKEEDVDSKLEKREDGTYATKIPYSSASYGKATALSFTVTFDAAKLSFKTIEGLETSDYAIQEGDGKYIIKITNLNKIKALTDSDNIMTVVFDPVSGVEIGADELDSLVKITASITSANTGDMVYALLTAAVLSIGTAAFVVTKKKKRKAARTQA